MKAPARRRRNRENDDERGQALIAVLVAVALVLGLLLTVLTVTTFSSRAVSRQLTYHGQTLNAAQAGITEGLSWFRRQTDQPVKAFVPIRDLNLTPPVNDTDDPNVGLVRDYEISAPSRVWGRYELKKTPSLAANATSLSFKDRWSGSTTYALDDIVLHTSTQAGVATTSYYRSRANANVNKNPATFSVGSPLWWDVVNTMDITKYKGKPSSGTVWQLESEGIVYVRNGGGAYNTLPNTVLSRAKLRTEIQRLSLNLPAASAVSVSRGAGVLLTSTAIRIRGGAKSALMYQASSGTPSGAAYTTSTPPPNTQITGTAPVAQAGITATPSRFTIPYIFGVTQNELESMADFNVASVASLPATLPSARLIVLRDPGNADATFEFTQARPLTGTGVVVVFGNLWLRPNSNSSFNGVIYVDGSYLQEAPSSVTGSVVVNNTHPTITRTFRMTGSGERSEIRYDANVIDFIEQRLGQYRITRSAYVP
jgi:Tfp pilus assembly protein PilX